MKDNDSENLFEKYQQINEIGLADVGDFAGRVTQPLARAASSATGAVKNLYNKPIFKATRAAAPGILDPFTQAYASGVTQPAKAVANAASTGGRAHADATMMPQIIKYVLGFNKPSHPPSPDLEDYNVFADPYEAAQKLGLAGGMGDLRNPNSYKDHVNIFNMHPDMFKYLATVGAVDGKLNLADASLPMPWAGGVPYTIKKMAGPVAPPRPKLKRLLDTFNSLQRGQKFDLDTFLVANDRAFAEAIAEQKAGVSPGAENAASRAQGMREEFYKSISIDGVEQLSEFQLRAGFLQGQTRDEIITHLLTKGKNEHAAAFTGQWNDDTNLQKLAIGGWDTSYVILKQGIPVATPTDLLTIFKTAMAAPKGTPVPIVDPRTKQNFQELLRELELDREEAGHFQKPIDGVVTRFEFTAGLKSTPPDYTVKLS